MAAHFKATQSGYSWMASSYLLANAACIPLWGKISDIWGRKPILLLANFIFLVGSLICALAINIPMILAGRAIQGAGGGGIIILANICVTDLFSVRYDFVDTCDTPNPITHESAGNDQCTTLSLVQPGPLRELWAPSLVVRLPPGLPGDGAFTSIVCHLSLRPSISSSTQT